MRIVLSLLLVLTSASVVQAQMPAALPATPAGLQATPLPSVVSQPEAATAVQVSAVRAHAETEAKESTAVRQRDRSIWFLLGAVAALAIVLAFAL